MACAVSVFPTVGTAWKTQFCPFKVSCFLSLAGTELPRIRHTYNGTYTETCCYSPYQNTVGIVYYFFGRAGALCQILGRDFDESNYCCDADVWPWNWLLITDLVHRKNNAKNSGTKKNWCNLWHYTDSI